jgi:hypothetical protein
VSPNFSLQLKLQIPSTKLQESSKSQNPKGAHRSELLLELDVWNFSGAWMLELGAFPGSGNPLPCSIFG